MTASPRVLVLRAPGTNCDFETAHAFERAGGIPDRVHINRLLESPALAADYQILCIPGGFSFGDDVGAGRILSRLIQHHLADVIADFHAADKLILGICNGFQVLIQTGIFFPMSSETPPLATLTWNHSGRFEDRWVHLAVAAPQCVFLRGLETMYLPVAHAEGRFVCRDANSLRQLSQQGQLALRYQLPPAASSQTTDTRSERDNGTIPIAYPHNPNGSDDHVAALCDTSGRALGLMPHPERFIDRTQHPRWTREPLPDQGVGLRLFENSVRYFC